METRKQRQERQQEAEKKSRTRAKVIFWAIFATPAIGFIYAAVYFVSSLAGMLAAIPK